MKYERHFYESVEAKRIPEDPRISDLERLKVWTGCNYVVTRDTRGIPTLIWHVAERDVFSEPGNWITKDENDCLTLWEDADFRANFTPIEPHLNEVLQPIAEYDENDLPEWNHRPIVVAYG